MNTLEDFKSFSKKAIEYLKEDLKSIRTGRASASLIEDLIVETYGGSTKLKLKELAGINSEDSTTLAVNPYDASTIQDIEKAILSSPLGLSPSSHGMKLLIKIPALNGEQREKMIKLISTKVEEKRETIRGYREDYKKKIRSQFDAKQITEDDKFRMEKELDETTKTFMEDMQAVKEKKEAELMEV